MYDDKSLIKLFSTCGFNTVIALPPGKTNLTDSRDLNLYEREDESVFVEGIK